MSLSGNVITRKRNLRGNCTNEKRITELKRILEKYQIGQMKFREVYFAKQSGETDQIFFVNIYGNMRTSVLVIESNDKTNVGNEYDIVQLKKKNDNDNETLFKGNRYYRRFMSDLESKFRLELTDYKYFEIKSGTSFMAIENPMIYSVSINDNLSTCYYLVVGDLITKFNLMTKIDPTYGVEMYDESQPLIKQAIDSFPKDDTQTVDDIQLTDNM